MADDLAPLFDFAVVLGLEAEPLFDGAAVRELFLRVGPPSNAAEKAEAVAFALSELGKSFAFDLWGEARPSADREEKEAEKLAAACGAVLSIAGVGADAEPTPDGLLPTFGPGGLFAAAALRGEPLGKAATMNSLHAVYLLRLDALKMAEIRRKRRRMKPAKAGRHTQAALKRLVAGIASVYFDTWDRVPTVGRSKANETSGEPTGTFIALMVAVTDALRARGVSFYTTAESLQKHWRQLPADEKVSFPKERDGLPK